MLILFKFVISVDRDLIDVRVEFEILSTQNKVVRKSSFLDLKLLVIQLRHMQRALVERISTGTSSM
jgi:hypothetical protein